MTLPPLGLVFNAQPGRNLYVAIDHRLCGEISSTRGIENMRTIVDACVEKGSKTARVPRGQAAVRSERGGVTDPFDPIASSSAATTTPGENG